MKRVMSAILIIFAAVLSGAELKIAENGQAQAGILIPANARPIVKIAATELADYLGKITGAKFTVGEKSAFKTNFKIGFGDPAGLDQSEFIIRTRGNDIEIYGHDTARKFNWFFCHYDCTEKGSLLGVYHLLDLLGVRWVTPDFEHVPAIRDLTIKDLNIRFKPVFLDRNPGAASYNFMTKYADSREYMKNADGAHKFAVRNFKSPRNIITGCHSEYALGLQKDPEWLSDQTRIRLSPEGKRTPGFSCWTHPDVMNLWIKAADDYFAGKSITEAGFKYTRGPYMHSKWPYPFISADEFMIDPSDHFGGNDGRCYCERCNEFRKKHPCADDSEIIWRVIAKVAEHIHRKYPGKYITTLVYPPKREIPSIKLPPNVRVKICLSGPKQMHAPKAYVNDMKQVERWKEYTGNPVSVWCYHLVGFNEAMPDIVETYPRKIAAYIKALRGKSLGIFMEMGGGSYTRDSVDSYIALRMLKNPDLDVEKELRDYYRYTYGPAAEDARKFFDRLEYLFGYFWEKTVPDRAKGLVNPWPPRDAALQEKLWTIAYTEKELESLGKILEAVIAKTKNTGYAKNAGLVRKYVYEPMVNTRNLRMAKEAVRLKSGLTAVKVSGSEFPPAEIWEKAPVFKLIPGRRFQVSLRAPASFQLASSKTHFFIRAELNEADMKKTVWDPKRKNVDGAIWNDNCVEIYIAPMNKEEMVHQILVNDRGAWSSRHYGKGINVWKNLDNCKIAVDRLKDRWIVKAAIPYQSFGSEISELRFNLVRTHRVKGQPVEYATTCPLALYGVWHIPDHYGTVNSK